MIRATYLPDAQPYTVALLMNKTPGPRDDFVRKRAYYSPREPGFENLCSHENTQTYTDTNTYTRKSTHIHMDTHPHRYTDMDTETWTHTHTRTNTWITDI